MLPSLRHPRLLGATLACSLILGPGIAEAAFGGKVKNIRIRERGSGAGYLMTATVDGGGLDAMAGLEVFIEDGAGLEPVENPVILRPGTGLGMGVELFTQDEEHISPSGTYQARITSLNADGKPDGNEQEVELPGDGSAVFADALGVTVRGFEDDGEVLVTLAKSGRNRSGIFIVALRPIEFSANPRRGYPPPKRIVLEDRLELVAEVALEGVPSGDPLGGIATPLGEGDRPNGEARTIPVNWALASCGFRRCEVRTESFSGELRRTERRLSDRHVYVVENPDRKDNYKIVSSGLEETASAFIAQAQVGLEQAQQGLADIIAERSDDPELRDDLEVVAARKAAVAQMQADLEAAIELGAALRAQHADYVERLLDLTARAKTARLFYLRQRQGKSARIRERR